MAKSSPEKLAAALRANLLRRKNGPAAKPAKPPRPDGGQHPDKSPKNSA